MSPTTLAKQDRSPSDAELACFPLSSSSAAVSATSSYCQPDGFCPRQSRPAPRHPGPKARFRAGRAGKPAIFRSRVPCRHRAENRPVRAPPSNLRSEEHTSELQSLMRISYAVFCLKKNKQTINIINDNYTQYTTLLRPPRRE